MSEPASGTQAVDRAALLVATVVKADSPLPFGELAEECALPKSTASRLLSALERTELLERNEAGDYVAGPLFWLHASRHDPWEELAALAQPVLEAVSEETRETVNLGAARGSRVVHIAQVDSTYLLGTRDWTLLEVPPHTSALGKVLYAHGALEHPAGRLEPVTARTLRDSRALEADLARVRRQGFATTVDELEVGLTGIAAPILDAQGQAVAALGISGPTQRLERRLDELGRFLIEQAGLLAARLRTHHHIGKTGKEGVA